MGGKDHHIYMCVCVYLYLLRTLKLCLAFRTASLSRKRPTSILQGNLKLSVCNRLNLLLGRTVGPCPDTSPQLGCHLSRVVTYMRACNQVLCTVLKLVFLF